MNTNTDTYRSPWDDATGAEIFATELELEMHRSHYTESKNCMICEADGPTQ